jgi:hypothetical protein
MAFAIAGCGGGPAASDQSAPKAPSGKSDSYKGGYADGLNGTANERASETIFGVSPNDHRQACNEGYRAAISNQVHPWDQGDFMEGCMQALQDHPPSSGKSSGPTVDCSKPENLTNGHCF